MDDLLCDGTEKDLAECRFEGWGANDCDVTEAAGVVCKHEATEEDEKAEDSKQHKKKKHRLHKHARMEVRLTGGRTKYEGNVEVGPAHLHLCCAVHECIIHNFFRTDSLQQSD